MNTNKKALMLLKIYMHKKENLFTIEHCALCKLVRNYEYSKLIRYADEI